MPKHSHSEEIAKIEEVAIELRKSVIEMLLEAGSGHSAGPLGTADIFASLYFHILNIDPKNPQMPDRDRLVLSAGHICPILYATLAHRGFFPVSELKTLRKLGTRLQGHPHINEPPGVENTSGPLGQGLSQAIGMALSAKLNDQTHRVYCVGSDAELQEGQIWEAAMFAGNNHLHNLTWIIDRNNIQIDGYTEDIMPLEPLRQKLEAFNWHVLEIDGHNVEEIINACDNAKAIFERATVIIAHTIPGKDVDFMQYKFEWHGKPPNRVQAEKALKELRTLAGRIRSEHD
ncbi:transketolase [candidate division WWE3 bacterium RIFCSPLOWO2_12_FULL_36_10]|uniref:Transketolase n=1 Tax=candidate division WWE3 bacterium RIFCSPLOWO2_12_FULL_36_10 TaxID=1802630 RepID=A0A1F4VH75_UNCKA|nr:MAG: transketolase [candidate division WWE3 bacterium RIFCSPLOWO2_12_FULL_36_10]